MRESKGFDVRLQEMKFMYAGSDFDFITILNLEDEYDKITKDNPDHTKKRSEILEMRRRLTDRLRLKNQ